MKITSVEKNKNKKKQFSVYIDETFAFSIPEEDYLSLNLYEEREIKQEELKNIIDKVVFNAAKASAVKYLSLKLKTEAELRNKLKEYRYDDEIINRVTSELKAMGYVNNRLYIQKFLYDRSILKPKAKKMLKMELLNKGLPIEEIDEALDGWNIDEYALALSLAKKRYGKYDIRDNNVAKKIFMFLQHRGFASDIIFQVIQEMAISK